MNKADEFLKTLIKCKYLEHLFGTKVKFQQEIEEYLAQPKVKNLPDAFDEIIDELEKSNPYPSDVFTEPSDKDWKRAWKLLEKNGIIPDRIAAKWGRMTWQNCINKMKELEHEKYMEH